MKTIISALSGETGMIISLIWLTVGVVMLIVDIVRRFSLQNRGKTLDKELKQLQERVEPLEALKNGVWVPVSNYKVLADGIHRPVATTRSVGVWLNSDDKDMPYISPVRFNVRYYDHVYPVVVFNAGRKVYFMN